MSEQLVLVMYQEERELRCPRGCHSEGTIPGRFALNLAHDRDHAAELIAEFMSRDGEESHRGGRAVMVFRNWTDLTECSYLGHEPPTQDGTTCIEVPFYRNLNDTWTEEEQDAANALCQWLREDVDRRLKDKAAHAGRRRPGPPPRSR